jgi:hypothetical protein
MEIMENNMRFVQNLNPLVSPLLLVEKSLVYNENLKNQFYTPHLIGGGGLKVR